MTLLTVAKGKFPLFVNDENKVSDSVAIGGPKGFWNMIQAICDQDPPVAGPTFSKQFNQFVDKCLQKDPLLRWTAIQLLESTFITHHSAVVGKTATVIQQYAMFQQPLDTVEAISFEKFHSSNVNIDDENSIVYAIRMEHLDRILGKMSQKLDLKRKELKKDNDTPHFKMDTVNFRTPTSNNCKSSAPRVHFDHTTLPSNDSCDEKSNRPSMMIQDFDSHTSADQSNLATKRAYSFGQQANSNQQSDSVALPLFDSQGLIKWKCLSEQLHLPLPIVLIAARARLGHLIDLDHHGATQFVHQSTHPHKT